MQAWQGIGILGSLLCMQQKPVPCQNCLLHLRFLTGENVCAGDGNCAYRAIMFGLVENAFHSQTARSYLSDHLQRLHSSMPSWTLIHHSLDNQGCTADEGYHVLLVSCCACKRFHLSLSGVCTCCCWLLFTCSAFFARSAM